MVLLENQFDTLTKVIGGLGTLVGLLILLLGIIIANRIYKVKEEMRSYMDEKLISKEYFALKLQNVEDTLAANHKILSTKVDTALKLVNKAKTPNPSPASKGHKKR